MIRRRDKIQRYCSEDISLIENYREAVSSPELYDLHHKDEIDLKLSINGLKKINRYFNVPAERLIFLKHDEHARLHANESRGVWVCPLRLLYMKNIEHKSNRQIAKELNCSHHLINKRCIKLTNENN